MAAKTYSWSIIDRTAYAPDPALGRTEGFIEYVLRFVNDADANDTFDDRVQANGTLLDLQAKTQSFLADKFQPPPTDQVPENATGKFSVNSQVLPV